MTELAGKVAAERSFPETLTTWANDILRQWNELQSRTRGLSREVEEWVGPLTADQLSRKNYYQQMVGTLGRETQAIAQRIGTGSTPGGGE